MKKVIVFLLITSFSFAQNADRKYISHTWKKNILELKTNDGLYQIKYLSDKIIETSFIPSGETYNPNSEAVIITSGKNKVKLTDGVKTLKLYSKDITISIDKAPLKISYLKKDAIILSEKNGYFKKDGLKLVTFI
jgi:oligosaccharide 4-alpha-D-glucosyltransferase